MLNSTEPVSSSTMVTSPAAKLLPLLSVVSVNTARDVVRMLKLARRMARSTMLMRTAVARCGAAAVWVAMWDASS